MFKVGRLRGHFVITLCNAVILVGLVLCCRATWASDGNAAFDIPSQPLDRAVEQFSRSSGWSVMYQSDLASGLRSHPVKGHLQPALALHELLRGTGLEAEASGPGRVILRAAASPMLPTPASDTMLTADERRQRYASVQQALRAALCADPALVPGTYQARLAFGVDARGHTHGISLETGTGDAARDARLRAAVAALQLPAASASLPQPVQLHLRLQPGSRECGAAPSSP